MNGVQMTGKQKIDPVTNLPLYLTTQGDETTDVTGVQSIVEATIADGGVLLWLDSGHLTTIVPTVDPQNFRAIKAVTSGGQPIYVDGMNRQVFEQYGANIVTNGNFNDFVASDGASGGWSASNIDLNGGYRSYCASFFFVGFSLRCATNSYYILTSNGDAATDPTLAQTLTGLIPGVTYRVQAKVQNAYPAYGTPDTAQSFVVSVGPTANCGQVTTTCASTTKALAPNGVWTAFTMTFVANNATEFLTLRGEVGTDASFSIDDVVVQAQNARAFVTDFAAGSDLYLDLAGRKTTDKNSCHTATSSADCAASLFPINETHLKDFVRTADVITDVTSGSDTLRILTPGSTSGLTATVDTVSIPVTQLAAGLPVLYGGATYLANPHAQTYFGGEAVVDPFTGLPLTWQTNAPVEDLFHRGVILTEPDGVTPLRHQIGDPMLHVAGDPVVHVRGEIQTYLGGEAVVDENGNPVYNGSSKFLHLADQGKITNRGQQVYYLAQSTGALVPVTSGAYNAPSKIFLHGISSSTVLQLSDFYTVDVLTTGYQLAVTVYDGANIYNLDASEFSVDLANQTV
jgi:hypothetical protein